MAVVNFKVTVWEAWDVPEGADHQKIVEMVKNSDSQGIQTYLEEFNEKGSDWGYLDETSSIMTLEDNGGEATIDFYEDYTLLAANGKVD